MCVRMLSATCGVWLRAWRGLTRFMRERYRPEKHYMRGPGPKHRAQNIEHDAGKKATAGTSAHEKSNGSEARSDRVDDAPTGARRRLAGC